jgi:hypothetical protein
MKGITLRKFEYAPYYWKKDIDKKEKIGSIFLHVAIEDEGKLKVIYEQHASSEQGYIEDPSGKFHDFAKLGKKPDVAVLDEKNKKIFILEAEFADNVSAGVKQLEGFSEFENKCKEFYPNYTYERFVILFGDKEFSKKMIQANQDKVIFRLKKDGTMITYDKCPQSIKDVIDKLKK